MRSILRTTAIAAALALAGWTTGAHAGIVVETDNAGTGNNVVFNNSCNAPSDATPGDNVLQGCLNTNPDAVIRFTADAPIELQGVGQASIVGVNDGTFSSLLIEFIVPSSADLLSLNIDILDSAGDAETVTFTTTPGGTSAPQALDPKGENKFTIYNTGEQEFTSLLFTTSGGIDGIVVDVKQVRINPGEGGGPDPIPTPEPATLALFGLGLLGLVGAGRLRRRQR